MPGPKLAGMVGVVEKSMVIAVSAEIQYGYRRFEY
jgi:hypothetical protein